MSEIPPWQPPSGFSNYPRETQSSEPYRRPPGVYFEDIGVAWKLVQANFGTWVLAGLIYGVLAGIPIFGLEFFFMFDAMMKKQPPDPSMLIIFYPAMFLITLVLQVLVTGQMYMGVKQARGEPIAVADVFVGFRRMGSIIIGTFLMWVLVFAGACLCIVPAFYVSGLLLFVPLLILDKGITPIEAITMCYENLRPHAWAIFAVMFVASLLAMVGYCACVVGLLFTMPIYYVTIGLTYNNFFPRANPQSFVYNQQIGSMPPQ